MEANPVKNPLNSERTIQNVTSLNKIQPEWRDLVDASIFEILRNASYLSVISIYLRGSVAVGRAISKVSDIDLTVIISSGSYSKCWRNIIEGKLSSDFDLVREVEISIYDIQIATPINKSRFKPSVAFSIKTQSLLLWGRDISREIPFFRADKDTALEIFHEKIPVLLRRLLNDADLYWCKRQIIRLGAYVTMLKRDYYTRDIYLITEDLCEIFPEEQQVISDLHNDIIYRLEDVSRDALEAFMWKLVKKLNES
jgi:hypothetical protein